MKYAIIALMMCTLLTACGGGNSSRLAVPDVVEYSRETQSRMANELEKNDVPALREGMKDYKVMRDQARVANGQGAR